MIIQVIQSYDGLWYVRFSGAATKGFKTETEALKVANLIKNLIS